MDSLKAMGIALGMTYKALAMDDEKPEKCCDSLKCNDCEVSDIDECGLLDGEDAQ